MASETITAHLLARGDVIRVDGQHGWYIVSSAFQEGVGGPIDLDLIREDGQGTFNWHAAPEERIERRS